MSLTSDFMEAVANEKILLVKIMLKDSLLIDLGGEDFEEMFEYAKDHISSLMDMHDGEDFKNPDDWTEEYFNEQMVIVINNFSEERVELLRKMSRKLFNSKNEMPENKQRDLSGNKPEKKRLGSVQKAGIAVASVGTATVVTGIIFGTPIVVPILGGSAVIAGGAMILLGKGK